MMDIVYDFKAIKAAMAFPRQNPWAAMEKPQSDTSDIQPLLTVRNAKYGLSPVMKPLKGPLLKVPMKRGYYEHIIEGLIKKGAAE